MLVVSVGSASITLPASIIFFKPDRQKLAATAQVQTEQQINIQNTKSFFFFYQTIVLNFNSTVSKSNEHNVKVVSKVR